MQKRSAEQVGPVCFERPSHYEITVNGRKLVGSAQLRRKVGLLQHGSIPLAGDPSRICEALSYPDVESREQARAQVRRRAVTLGEALGRPVIWQEAAAALVAGFQQVFELQFCETGLTEEEAQRANQLAETVYANPAWTQRR